ncbi:MAG TPA: hypothetical protein PKC76_00565 [Saprospiraceae bacterium]|nr:hypothetical protein [Saprospiraceae bacterium]HMP22584.1 hypothetical protein [Saprospiraceae bacterium]
MKLRCTHNSLRLRLRKSDIAQLQSEGFVQERVTFGAGQTLTYRLQIAAVPALSALFENGCICVQIPTPEAQRWMDSEQVGLENDQLLHILVEKDFPCRHTEESDREDTFYELAPEEEETPDNC